MVKFCGQQEFPELDYGDSCSNLWKTQICELTIHRFVNLWVLMAYKLYLNKTSFKDLSKNVHSGFTHNSFLKGSQKTNEQIMIYSRNTISTVRKNYLSDVEMVGSVGKT